MPDDDDEYWLEQRRQREREEQDDAIAYALGVLGENLAIAGALCRSFDLGRIYGFASCPCGDYLDDEDYARIDLFYWHPKCGRAT